MRLLVTGGTGQVGEALQRLAPSLGVTVIAPGRDALDLSKPDTLRIPDGIEGVINAGAYTAVDRAEGDVDLAMTVNAGAAGVLAEAAAKRGLPIVQLSTDYVFDGSKASPYLETDPGKVHALLYDLVANGIELASGSIRIHRRDIQERVMKVLGITAEDAERRFGFLLEAFQYGAPPHGGIAPGLDRLIMLMSGRKSLRDVIAFPKTARATSLMDQAPAEVDPEDLEALHIRIVE